MAADQTKLHWHDCIEWLRKEYLTDANYDARLPSEIALTEASGNQFKMSQVRKALTYLAEVGEIKSKRGSGHFVNLAPRETIIFRRDLPPLNQKQKVDRSVFTRLPDSPLQPEWSAMLGITTCENAISFRSVRQSVYETAPTIAMTVAMSTHYFSPDVIDAQQLNRDVQDTGSITSALRRQNIAFRRTETLINVRRPDRDEQSVLKIGRHDTIIETTGLNNREDSGKPVELTITRWPAKFWKLKFES